MATLGFTREFPAFTTPQRGPDPRVITAALPPEERRDIFARSAPQSKYGKAKTYLEYISNISPNHLDITLSDKLNPSSALPTGDQLKRLEGSTAVMYELELAGRNLVVRYIDVKSADRVEILLNSILFLVKMFQLGRVTGDSDIIKKIIRFAQLIMIDSVDNNRPLSNEDLGTIRGVMARLKYHPRKDFARGVKYAIREDYEDRSALRSEIIVYTLTILTRTEIEIVVNGNWDIRGLPVMIDLEAGRLVAFNPDLLSDMFNNIPLGESDPIGVSVAPGEHKSPPVDPVKPQKPPPAPPAGRPARGLPQPPPDDEFETLHRKRNNLRLIIKSKHLRIRSLTLAVRNTQIEMKRPSTPEKTEELQAKFEQFQASLAEAQRELTAADARFAAITAEVLAHDDHHGGDLPSTVRNVIGVV